MFLWLFNIHMGGLVREVNTRAIERRVALKMSTEARVWEVKQFLFADNAALVSELD